MDEKNLEQPPGGGSYLRNPDGSLTEIDPPTKPPAETNEPVNNEETSDGTTGTEKGARRKN